MTDDLFIKKIPHVIKELIAREAERHHRSVNQESIALLEEALLQRMESRRESRASALDTLARYAAQAGSRDPAGVPPVPSQA